MLKMPPFGETRNFQIKTVAAPANIPVMAPHLLQRFQNSAKSITGPKVAPKPAQAKETTRKMELLGLLANITPSTATQMTVIRAMSIFFFSSTFRPNT